MTPPSDKVRSLAPMCSKLAYEAHPAFGPCGPTPGGALHSETILRNKLMSLNKKKNCYLVLL